MKKLLLLLCLILPLSVSAASITILDATTSASNSGRFEIPSGRAGELILFMSVWEDISATLQVSPDDGTNWMNVYLGSAAPHPVSGQVVLSSSYNMYTIDKAGTYRVQTTATTNNHILYLNLLDRW